MSTLHIKINLSFQNLRKQRGVILMVMLVLLVVGSSAFLVNAMSNSSAQMERKTLTNQTLAKAKNALISYAITYADKNSNVNGFLPCPDIDGTPAEGSAKGTCGGKNISAIGKFPWKTLGVEPPKDSSGECLWYAVSGTYKNNPDTDFMNWDNNGLFQVMAANGTSFLTGATTDNQAVAVIIAPDASLNTQNRTSTPGTTCGGNYTSSHYLETDTVHSINNATVSTTASVVSQFITGPVVDSSNNTIVNDHIIYISKNDIFNAIKKRKDFSSSVAALMNEAVSCLSAYPTPKTINFDTMSETAGGTAGMMMNQLVTGRIPSSSCTGSSNIHVQKWGDNLAYAICNSGQCLTINGSPCRGVVIFSGERNAIQNRATNAQKNTWNNYLESSALNIFTTGAATVTGVPTTYNPALPSTDVWACL